jgi:hypothetical protein
MEKNVSRKKYRILCDSSVSNVYVTIITNTEYEFSQKLEYALLEGRMKGRK